MMLEIKADHFSCPPSHQIVWVIPQLSGSCVCLHQRLHDVTSIQNVNVLWEHNKEVLFKTHTFLIKGNKDKPKVFSLDSVMKYPY